MSHKIKMRTRGFGIIEAMIAIGILSVVSLGMMTVVNNVFSSQRSAQILADVSLLTNQISSAIQNPVVCMQSFPATLAITTTGAKETLLPSIVGPGGTTLVQTGVTNLPQGDYQQVNEIKLVLTSAATTIPSGAKIYSAKLHFGTARNGGTAGLGGYKSPDIPLVVTLDNTNHVLSCSSSGALQPGSSSGLGNQSCPAGYYVSGLDNSGVIVCTNLPLAGGPTAPPPPPPTTGTGDGDDDDDDGG